MGLSTGFIAASQLSSSSTYNSSTFSQMLWGPHQARLRTGSCWCGGLNSWRNDWLQVDLGMITNLRGIAIQGDPVEPPNDIKEFYVQISDNGIKFNNITKVKNEYGSNVVCYVEIVNNSYLYYDNGPMMSLFASLEPFEIK